MSLRPVTPSHYGDEFAVNQPPSPQAEAPPDAQRGSSAGKITPDPGVFAHSQMWQQVYERPRPVPSPPADTDGQIVSGPAAPLADDGLDVRQATLSVTEQQTTVSTTAAVVEANAQPAATATLTDAPARPKTLAEMTASDLQRMSDAEKRALLAGVGVSAKHLKKTKGAKLDRALLDVIAALRSPGGHKLTLKLDKKYELKVQVGQDGQVEQFALKQKKGFWGKLGGVLKTVAAIAGPLLAPVTGGASLLISSAIGAFDAIKNKNWLGAVASVAGALVPGAGSIAGKAVAKVATVVQRASFAVQSGMMAVRAQSPGGLLSAVAGGVSAFAGGVGRAGTKLSEAAQRLERWSNVAWRGESIVRAVRQKDFFSAASSALGFSADLSTGQTARTLQKYAGWVGQADAVRWGLRQGDYLGAATGALGLARDLRPTFGTFQPGVQRSERRWEEALRLGVEASRLVAAVRRKDVGQIAQVALSLGGTVAGVREEYFAEGGTGGRLGHHLYRAARMVGWADDAVRAARYGDYAGAASLALGLAADLSGDRRLAQAERIGQRAADLITALRTGQRWAISVATEGLVEGVQEERRAARAERERLVAQSQREARREINGPLPEVSASEIDLTPLRLPTTQNAPGATNPPLVNLAELGEAPLIPGAGRGAQAAQPPATAPSISRNAPLPSVGAGLVTFIEPQLGPREYAAIYRPNEKGDARWNLTYAVVRDVLRRNGVEASPAAIEEVAARMGHVDFSAGVNARGELVVDHRDGTWVEAGLHRDDEGRGVYGYQLTIYAEFQQQVLEHRALAEQVTRAGVRGLSEMRMQERMMEAVGIAYDKYLTGEARQSLGGITKEELATALAVGGAAGILVKAGKGGALGPVAAGVGVYEATRKYLSADEFIRLCGEAKTQADLDRAARHVGRLAGEMAKDGVLAAVAGVGAKVAPGVARKADEVFAGGVKWIRDTLNGPTGLDPVVVTPEGVAVRGVPGHGPLDRINGPLQMAGKVPDADYKGRPYTPEQKRRIAELGEDQIKGLVQEEGEAALAAEQLYGLKLVRYKDSGLEHVDQNGNHWDVMSPPSIGGDGKPAFKLDAVMKALKRHFLKGNVILDYGRLNHADAQKLRNAVDSLTEVERRGQRIITVRGGE